jgi:hypothetical protein
MNNLKHPLYSIWRGMKQRCYNKKSKAYKYYGARGIKVCERWKKSFYNFVVDVKKPKEIGLELDRINSNGNYEPENVKWSTIRENINNRRNTVFISCEDIVVPRSIAVSDFGYKPKKREVKITYEEAKYLETCAFVESVDINKEDICGYCCLQFDKNLCYMSKCTEESRCDKRNGYFVEKKKWIKYD